MNTSEKFTPVAWHALRTAWRSLRSGELSELITTRPDSAINLATSPARRMFSARSCRLKPKSAQRPCRKLSPSRIVEAIPRRKSRDYNASDSVDFPDPESPVSQITAPS